ncbi:hypothetical protein GJ496_004379 [Pomphorhynchus laevis]|nr:hypothetical protein GJ496_004379 [Pomphorhynchus laevis]
MYDLLYDLSLLTGFLSSANALVNRLMTYNMIKNAINIDDVIEAAPRFLDDFKETIFANANGHVHRLPSKLIPLPVQSLMNMTYSYVQDRVSMESDNISQTYIPFAIHTIGGNVIQLDNISSATCFPFDYLQKCRFDDVISVFGRVYRTVDRDFHIGPAYGIHQCYWPFIISSIPMSHVFTGINSPYMAILDGTIVLFLGILLANRIMKYVQWSRTNIALCYKKFIRYFNIRIRDSMVTNEFRIEMDYDRCIRCRRNIRNVICLPCAHLALCGDCSEGVTQCPWCFDDVLSKFRVYVS